jgi:hypothetical protein
MRNRVGYGVARMVTDSERRWARAPGKTKAFQYLTLGVDLAPRGIVS